MVINDVPSMIILGQVNLDGMILWLSNTLQPEKPLNFGKNQAGPDSSYCLNIKNSLTQDLNIDSLARKEGRNEIRVMNNCKTSLPSNIESTCGLVNILEVWRELYCNLLNCIKSNAIVVCNVAT